MAKVMDFDDCRHADTGLVDGDDKSMPMKDAVNATVDYGESLGEDAKNVIGKIGKDTKSDPMMQTKSKMNDNISGGDFSYGESKSGKKFSAGSDGWDEPFSESPEEEAKEKRMGDKD